MPPKTVLVIDDDAAILNILQRVLEDEGYQALTSVTADGFPAPQPPLPDLILLDVMLAGGENGLEVCRKLKQQTRTQHIPVVLMSANASLEMMGREEANGWLDKPFDLDSLFHILGICLAA